MTVVYDFSDRRQAEITMVYVSDDRRLAESQWFTSLERGDWLNDSIRLL